jgi:hypothetical protein
MKLFFLNCGPSFDVLLLITEMVMVTFIRQIIR